MAGVAKFNRGQRFWSEGRRTRLMFPLDGLNDFNDALRSERRYYPVLQK